MYLRDGIVKGEHVVRKFLEFVEILGGYDDDRLLVWLSLVWFRSFVGGEHTLGRDDLEDAISELKQGVSALIATISDLSG